MDSGVPGANGVSVQRAVVTAVEADSGTATNRCRRVMGPSVQKVLSSTKNAHLFAQVGV